MAASLDEDARVVGEFIRHGGGWGIGFRVAKWVKPGVGHGVRGKGGANAPSSDEERRRKIREKAARGEPLSSREFAFMAGVSKDRISRYARAWEKAADNKKVPHSSEIAPDTVWEPDEDQLGDWGYFMRLGKEKQERTPADESEIALGAILSSGAEEKSVHEIAEDAGVDVSALSAAHKFMDTVENGPPERKPKPEDSEIIALKKSINAMMKKVLEYDVEEVSEIVKKRADAEVLFDLFESIEQWSSSMRREMEAKMSERKLRAV